MTKPVTFILIDPDYEAHYTAKNIEELTQLYAQDDPARAFEIAKLVLGCSDSYATMLAVMEDGTVLSSKKKELVNILDVCITYMDV